jgi:hypothetical protein
VAAVEDIGQIYGWWLGEVELTFDPLSTLPLSVYPWREAPTMPLPRVAGDCKFLRRIAGDLYDKFLEIQNNDEDSWLSSRSTNVSMAEKRALAAQDRGRNLQSLPKQVAGSRTGWL